MGACQSIPQIQKPPLRPTENPLKQHTAAGCFFTDDSLFLAGYQPNKKKPEISGLGGKKKRGETPRQTAVRETLEELFDFHIIPKHILQAVNAIEPRKLVWNGSYAIFVYSFKNLETILKTVKDSNIESSVYENIPLTIIDLLLKRRISKKSEISHLCLLPCVKHEYEHPIVYPGLIEDIRLVS